MKIHRYIVLFLAMLCGSLSVLAQEVEVMVTPVKKVLPPQLLNYVSNPGQFFSVNISNLTDQEQRVYLVLDLAQIAPANDDMRVSCPSTYQPSTPFVVPPHQSYSLTTVDMKNLFNHIPSSAISVPQNLLEGYANGSFGLLPEGTYQVHFKAYKWASPAYRNPVLASHPSTGMNTFTVCYKASAPQFLTPTRNGIDMSTGMAVLDPSHPEFTWTTPQQACDEQSVKSYTYSIKIVENNTLSSPDYAMDHAPVVYQKSDLLYPYVTLPQTVMQQFRKDRNYLAQITATPSNSSILFYSEVENNGKSTLLNFRLKNDKEDKTTGTGSETKDEPGKGHVDTDTTPDTGIDPGSLTVPDDEVGDEDDYAQTVTENLRKAEEEDSKDDEVEEGDYHVEDPDGDQEWEDFLNEYLYGDEDENENENDDEGDNRKWDVIFGDISESDSLFNDSLYTFRNPQILEPSFFDGNIRQVYVDNPINASWRAPWFLGGEGTSPSSLTFSYDVELYNGEKESNWEAVLKKDPIYKKTTTEVSDSIPWDDIEDKVKAGDFILLRVVPKCTNAGSVAFVNDSIRMQDFVMAKHLTKDYFKCSNNVTIDNTTPTTKAGTELEGTTVGIGEYDLTIDRITSGNGEKGFTGTGRVKWELGIGTAMVHVKFENMKINTQNIVYEGVASSYANPHTMTNYEAVEGLFSDLGLENLLAKTGIPYASQIEEGTKKTISQSIDGLAGYYSLVKSAESIVDMLGGEPKNVYMPLCLPKDKLSQLNSSPVDIQVTTMKFAPTYATMDLLGEFTMPESNCLASEMLVFGAPRLCISPDHIVPESGQLALLDKFTVKDPSTDFECTFKAPSNLLEPTDGCYVSWKDYKFEVMGVDVDMKIPKLRKYDEAKDTVTNEMPVLNFKGMVASWDDFMMENISMDPFEVESLPGFTFYCSNMGYDHSVWHNMSSMSEFKYPATYNKHEGVGEEIFQQHGIDGWQGFYVGQIGLKMPKGIVSSDGRIELSGKKMLFDRSGVTFSLGADFGEDGMKGSAGGFDIALREIMLDVVQNNFNNCHMDGSLALPLLKNKDGEKAEIGFNCQIRKQLDNAKKETDNLAYIFNTKSLNGDYMLDLFLAKLNLDAKQTYFLLEAEPELASSGNGSTEAGEMRTRCELMLGGTIEIGGKETIQNFAKDKVGFDLHLPDIHFVGMRLANCKSWKSKYVDFQADINALRKEQQKNALAGIYTEGKEVANQDSTFFFHTGSWSLASLSKKLGPFEFSLKDYKFVHKLSGSNLDVGLAVTGKAALITGIDISAEASVTITGTLKNITKISNIDCDLGSVKLDSMAVHTAFCGFSIDGDVHWTDGETDPEVGKGFAAHLKIALPGNLFTVEGDGGMFKCEATDDEDAYSWGWVHLALGGKVELGPCAITKLGGGFYMNCGRNKDGDNKRPNNKAGLVGVYLELGMESPDGSTLKGDLSLNVVYNRKRKCLSQFLMTGGIKAVGGLIDSKVTLLYENTEQDRYLQLNITVDAKLSNESIASAVGEFGSSLGTLKEQMDALAGKSFDIVGPVSLGLGEKIGADTVKLDNDGNDESDSGSDQKSSGDLNDVKDNAKTEEQKEMAAKAKLKIELEMKITWRKGGTDLPKPKWHVYLGEPDESKRVSLVFIDFSSKMLNVKFGANCYLCLGNELPNNGELPPIPAKISQFLDGSQKGEAVQSDNIAAASAARDQALSSFKADAGVMLGAQVYGHIGLDLGIIYGNIDAIAGFDMSLVHFANAYCANLGREPGYNKWYGRGQLYAYLAMVLGVRFNLGFVNFDLPLVDAGVGGVLKMGGPEPFYFTGKVRAKVKLLGGLFKLDKSYQFDCGQTCQLFLGNALDDFKLFGDCTLGDTVRSDGWTQEKRIAADRPSTIDPNIRTTQYVDSEAPLNEHFRVLDQNEMLRIAGQFDEDSEEWNRMKMQASRTFIFRAPEYALLFTYDSPDTYTDDLKPVNVGHVGQRPITARDWHGAVRVDTIRYQMGSTTTRHFLDLAQLRKCLKPGKYYRLAVTGRAIEIEKGKEVDPYTVFTDGRSPAHEPWVRTTNYYFRTGEEKIVNDKAPLQDYVAIAYPSNYNRLTDNADVIGTTNGDKKVTEAYLSDVQRPTIALTEDIRTKAFKKGMLYWRLLNQMGKQVDIAPNKWVEYTKNGQVVGLNMEPAHALKAEPGKPYILSLSYFTEGTVINEDNGEEVSALVDTTLVYLHVRTSAADRNWRTGLDGTKGTEYDQPFIAQKFTHVNYNKAYRGTPTDKEMRDKGYNMYTPMSFVGYMSNYAFPAGWEITERNYYGIEVTTSESMIFQDPMGGGKYEGVYNAAANGYRTDKAFNAIRDVFNFVVPEDSDVPYPLSSYWHERDNRWDYVLDANSRTPRMAYSLKTDPTEYSLELTDPAFESIRRIYNDCYSMSQAINNLARKMDLVQAKYPSISYKKSHLKQWYADHRGTYLTENGFAYDVTGGNTFYLPVYQFPTIWSMGALEKASQAYEGMSNDCDRASGAYLTWGRMTGEQMVHYFKSAGSDYGVASAVEQQVFRNSTAYQAFVDADLTVYRVNTYNYMTGHYGVHRNLLNGMGEISFNIQAPLLSKKAMGGISYGSANSSEESRGTTTGDFSLQAKMDQTAEAAKDYTDYLQELVQKHDSIMPIYKEALDSMELFGSHYFTLLNQSSEAVELTNRALNLASKSGNVSDTEVSSTKKEAWKAIRNAEAHYQWIADLPKVVNTANKLQNGKTILTLFAEMKQLMDNHITPNSDTSSREYKRYNKLYQDALEWTSSISGWSDSIKACTTSSRLPYGSAYQALREAADQSVRLNFVNTRAENGRKYLQSITEKQELMNGYVNTAKADHESVEAEQKNQLSLLKGIRNTAELKKKLETASQAEADALSTTISSIRQHAENAKKKLQGIRLTANTFAHQALVDVVGDDGKSGLLGLIAEQLNTECDPYVEGKKKATDMVGKMTTIKRLYNQADSLYNLMQKESDGTQELLSAVQYRLDELSGKNPTAAIAALKEMDGLAQQLTQFIDSHKAEQQRQGSYTQLMALYATLQQDYAAYKSGHLPSAEPCMKNGKTFQQYYERTLQTCTTFVSEAEALIGQAEAVRGKIGEAGYGRTSTYIKEAQQKWSDAGSGELTSWYNSARNCVTELEQAYSKSQPNVNDIYAECQAYMESGRAERDFITYYANQGPLLRASTTTLRSHALTQKTEVSNLLRAGQTAVDNFTSKYDSFGGRTSLLQSQKLEEMGSLLEEMKATATKLHAAQDALDKDFQLMTEKLDSAKVAQEYLHQHTASTSAEYRNLDTQVKYIIQYTEEVASDMPRLKTSIEEFDGKIQTATAQLEERTAQYNFNGSLDDLKHGITTTSTPTGSTSTTPKVGGTITPTGSTSTIKKTGGTITQTSPIVR